MKRYISALLLFILTGCFISCEKDINFKGIITDPLLVLNGLLTPNEVVSIYLSQSRFILGDVKPFTPISDATVSLFVNGSLKEQLTHDANGLYMGTYLPKPGDEIKVEVRAEGFDLVKSQTIIPHKPSVMVNDSTVTVEEQEIEVPNQPNTIFKDKVRDMQIQLKLTDAADEENYYYIKATKNFYRKDMFEDLLINRIIIELNLSEMLKNNIVDGGTIFDEFFGDGGTSDRTENLFSDTFINGKEILFDFSFHDIIESSKYVNGEKEDGKYDAELTVEYIIEIAEFSKDFNQYVISGNEAENAKDFPFSEPVQVHTNIENGIGILGASNSYRFVSRFESKYYYYPY